jgi:LysR family glycine cleavage system transcriptional activator
LRWGSTAITSRIPNISALRAFEATTRLQSVSNAARELNVTDGAVSRAVRELEAQLGVSLFERRNRQVIPTAAARMLAEEIRSALEQLSLAIGRAKQRASRSATLTISCEPTFLIRWLIPRLSGLQAALGPDREIRLISAGGAPPFLRDGIDLAIRRADFPIGQEVAAASFLEERVGPVCRRDVEPGDLLGTLLHSATRPDAWARWADLTGSRLAPRRTITFEHFYLSLQAAVAGTGTAMGPIALVADDLASGALVAPQGFVPDGSHYVLMALKTKRQDLPFDTALAWLRQACAELEGLTTAKSL